MKSNYEPRKHKERILNCIPSRNIESDWRIEHAAAAGIVAAGQIPPKRDLRDDSWWSIQDQAQTGSCVGWSCADGLLRWHFVKAGSITQNQLMSVRFLWMAAKETDEYTNCATTFIESAGTSIKAALDIARNYGAMLDTDLPFDGKLSPLQVEAFYALAASRKISSYFNLTTGDKLSNIRQWIANNGPVAVRLDVDSTWDNVGADGKLDSYDSSHTRGGHAVALVGYDKDSFIVRNSWGTKLWGDKGYGYASNAYTAAAFTEVYGIKV
jgi:C1A family cysteine protease